MNQCGLLSKNSIRQIQSDIVTIEALSRLQQSEIQSQIESHHLGEEEEKREQADDLFTEVLIEEKAARLSDEIQNYNKQKNHFSKSTADDDEINVRDLENLLGVDHINRNSSAVGSLGF